MPTSDRPPSAPQRLDKQLLKGLRQQAHALKPVIRLGQNGLTEAVLAELELAIAHHGLVKIKLAAEDADARQAQVDAMRDATGAALIQRIGHVATLYREPVEKSRPSTSSGTSRSTPRSRSGSPFGAKTGQRPRVGSSAAVTARRTAASSRSRRR